jgi:protein gp37
MRRPGGLPRNCVAMTSITDQRTADARIPHLRRVRARWRGVSAEPLLGPVDLHSPHIKIETWLVGESFDGPKPLDGIHWLILGGESGPNARDCDLTWITDLVAQGRRAGIAVFLKQLGASPVRASTLQGMEGFDILHLADEKGGDWDEWPAGLQIREMPDFNQPEVAS